MAVRGPGNENFLGMKLVLGRQGFKAILRSVFTFSTLHLTSDHRDGFKLVAKTALQHRWLIVAAFFFNVLAGIFEGGTMGILALAVSVLIEQKPVTSMLTGFGSMGVYLGSFLADLTADTVFLILVGVAVSTQVLKSMVAYVAKYAAITLQFRVNRHFQETSTNHVMEYSYGEIIKQPSGILAGLIGQAAQVGGMIMVANEALLSTTLFLTYIVMMFVFSFPLALVALVIVGLMSFGLAQLRTYIRALGERIISGGLKTTKASIEFLQAPRLLRANGITKYAKDMINAFRADALQAGETSSKLKALVGPVVDVLTIITAGIFLVGGYLIAGDNLMERIPKLLLFLLILNRMMPQVRSLNEVRLGLASSEYLLSTTGKFLRTEDKEFERTGGRRFDRLRETICFENVTFNYPGTSTQVLTDFTCDITKGETVALVGASGAGKSTVASLLLGLFEPTSGRITVDGIDLRSLDLSDWRRRIGSVDQEVFLLNASVLDNIALAVDEYTISDVVAAARRAHAHGFVEKLPHKYNSMIGDRGVTLSGGQQQRLALARALFRAPGILILDEATSSLDSHSERLIQKTLEELPASITMLIIAHRLSTISAADKIIVMEQGRIVESGKFKDLISAAGTFEKLWRVQVNERDRAVNMDV